MAKKNTYHTRDEINKTSPSAKARDNLSGDFAGNANDRKHGTNLKERKLPRDSGKTPKN